MNFTSVENVEKFELYQESVISIWDLFKLVPKYLESKYKGIS
jgi:hypothetical protein